MGPLSAEVFATRSELLAPLARFPRASSAATVSVALDGPAHLDAPAASAPILPGKAGGAAIHTAFVRGVRAPGGDHYALTVGRATADVDLDRRVRSALRLVFVDWLTERGGIALHAASVLSRGRAWVLIGRSGAGKTTVARTFPEDGLLGDDLAALTLDGPVPIVHATPFAGREGTPATAGSAPLAGFAVLAQGPKTQAAPLPPRDAVLALLRHTFSFRDGAAERAALLDRALALSRGFPVLSVEVDLAQSPFELEAFACQSR
jgi:hypothetical protein